jgi:hypothetical protein
VHGARAVLGICKATIVPALGYPAPYPRYGFSEAMLGDGRGAFWAALLESVGAVGGALFAAFGTVITRLVLRLRWLALVATALFLSLTATYDMSVLPLSLVFPLTSGALLTVVAIRFGLLPFVVAWFAWGALSAPCQ